MSEFATLKELLRGVTHRFADETAFVLPGRADDETITYGAFARDVDAFGTALLARGLRGSRIAVLGPNSYRWIVAYFAAACGGNAVVPLDRDLPAEDLLPLLENSGAAALVYAPDYEDMIPAFEESAGGLRRIRMDTDMRDMLAEGRALLAKGDEAFSACAVSPDDLATIVYTSGTTGASKGVALTHANIAADAAAAAERVPQGGRCVLALPLHHTLGMLAGVIVPLMNGIVNCVSRSVTSVGKDMVKMQATVAVLVPAFVEAIYDKILAAAEERGQAGKLRAGLMLGRAMTKLGMGAPRNLFSDALAAMGGELRQVFCGGAPISARIVGDFRAMGVEILNCYGITECAPVVSVSLPGGKIGSAGLPVRCNTVRIAGGEIQVRGDNVMRGYYRDEAATRAAFTPDGWLKTGDLGRLDRAGRLYVTGRIKHLIILSNGKNISPEALEEKLRAIPGVKEAAVYGEDGKLAAEIYIDPQAASTEADVRGGIAKLNGSLPQHMRIGIVKFRGSEFEKTTTMKIKKHAIHDNKGESP